MDEPDLGQAVLALVRERGRLFLFHFPPTESPGRELAACLRGPWWAANPCPARGEEHARSSPCLCSPPPRSPAWLPRTGSDSGPLPRGGHRHPPSGAVLGRGGRRAGREVRGGGGGSCWEEEPSHGGRGSPCSLCLSSASNPRWISRPSSPSCFSPHCFPGHPFASLPPSTPAFGAWALHRRPGIAGGAPEPSLSSRGLLTCPCPATPFAALGHGCGLRPRWASPCGCGQPCPARGARLNTPGMVLRGSLSALSSKTHTPGSGAPASRDTLGLLWLPALLPASRVAM